MSTMTVRQVLDIKGHKVHCVAPGVTVFEALALMAEYNIGAVLVTDGERLVGIFTERDYARKVVLKGLRSAEVSVGDLMTPAPATVGPEQTVDEVMNIMTDKRFRHLPVMENGRLAGIITIGDVVKSIIDLQRRTISHLSNYIAGDIAT
ncbi:CBS domain-containing protein [Pseudothauera rhizosphaerae]|uniref:CBS domain-containing protein n=1 Tax=Pseudothauera rhizosphaerae TaxID=2565932 RepID=A0A4S4A991_9RHOO|nr:CBS domain-containing protein [Pseudothauera rhizosphaerae]THF55383.1 CBS domain-containing protein [Pseudothauera rhizosphaerae]